MYIRRPGVLLFGCKKVKSGSYKSIKSIQNEVITTMKTIADCKDIGPNIDKVTKAYNDGHEKKREYSTDECKSIFRGHNRLVLATATTGRKCAQSDAVAWQNCEAGFIQSAKGCDAAFYEICNTEEIKKYIEQEGSMFSHVLKEMAAQNQINRLTEIHLRENIGALKRLSKGEDGATRRITYEELMSFFGEEDRDSAMVQVSMIAAPHVAPPRAAAEPLTGGVFNKYVQTLFDDNMKHLSDKDKATAIENVGMIFHELNRLAHGNNLGHVHDEHGELLEDLAAVDKDGAPLPSLSNSFEYYHTLRMQDLHCGDEILMTRDVDDPFGYFTLQKHSLYTIDDIVSPYDDGSTYLTFKNPDGTYVLAEDLFPEEGDRIVVDGDQTIQEHALKNGQVLAVAAVDDDEETGDVSISFVGSVDFTFQPDVDEFNFKQLAMIKASGLDGDNDLLKRAFLKKGDHIKMHLKTINEDKIYRVDGFKMQEDGLTASISLGHDADPSFKAEHPAPALLGFCYVWSSDTFPLPARLTRKQYQKVRSQLLYHQFLIIEAVEKYVPFFKVYKAKKFQHSLARAQSDNVSAGKRLASTQARLAAAKEHDKGSEEYKQKFDLFVKSLQRSEKAVAKLSQDTDDATLWKQIYQLSLQSWKVLSWLEREDGVAATASAQERAAAMENHYL